MQAALTRLSSYWADHGCLLMQPMNTEVGAGTLNPATALRVLGPEPWRVAYAEPSVRPDDARYGQNPNRLQSHTQYQVILKPEPGNPQELYLGSLAALGIDVQAHDVRFVEDNWASPALGAWGLGWEVWLDGLEITQFTYFQQAGGIALDPVSVEITYGMERILMAVQGVRHFKDLLYAPGVSYGEIFAQTEYEMSRYYLDDADVGTTRDLLERYAGEAQRMVDLGLPIPAHILVLKMSHAFNILDSRGVVSTADRAREFSRMRHLSGAVAHLWIATREKAGFPLLPDPETAPPAPPAIQLTPRATPATTTPAPDAGGAAQPLLFEIGVEEMPPAEAEAARAQVETTLTSLLGAGRLEHGNLSVWATPRRIVAHLESVAARESDTTMLVRGPKVAAAFTATGEATKAGSGFARANQVDVPALGRVSENGVEYVAVRREEIGRPAGEALAPVLTEVVRSLRSAKNMRWSDPDLSFTRPIRWLLALLGPDIVPVHAGGLHAGRLTTLTRVVPGSTTRAGIPATLTLATAGEYSEAMTAAGILLDQDQRRQHIAAAAAELAAGIGGRIDARAESGLLDQITYLVEAPTPVLGSFDPQYLNLPDAVLTTVMRKHQRYLPVRDRTSGALLARFVAVANASIDVDAVRAGNEAVLRARFEDALFFHRADLKTPLTVMRERLGRLTFTDQLGSMLQRADRIGALAAALAPALPLNEQERADLARAGALVKFDLGSQMVIELTSLAGIMAREYALAAGEPPAVAQALLDVELPRSAGDALPESGPGAVLALADRLDALTGLAATVGIPTGSSDPFAVRRAALGALTLLRSHPVLAGVSLAEALTAAAERQPVPVPEATLTDLRAFLARRLELVLSEEGHPIEHLRALASHALYPHRTDQLLAQLGALTAQADFTDLAAALQRARRIVPAATGPGYNPADLHEPAEQALAEALTTAHHALAHAGPDLDLITFTTLAAPLTARVQDFFRDVMVMSENPGERAARLGLLAGVRDLGAGILDWDALHL